jgi:hypothetical protein
MKAHLAEALPMQRLMTADRTMNESTSGMGQGVANPLDGSEKTRQKGAGWGCRCGFGHRRGVLRASVHSGSVNTAGRRESSKPASKFGGGIGILGASGLWPSIGPTERLPIARCENYRTLTDHLQDLAVFYAKLTAL